MKIPKAVLISDVHFSLQNLEVASKAMNLAYDKARELNCILIIAGDLHDSKALLRGECVNKLIEIFSKNKDIKTYCLVGNHDKINEKSEDHSIKFLSSYITVVDESLFLTKEKLGLIPYQSTNEKFLNKIQTFEPGTILITHQGYLGAYMGEYFKDDSSVDPSLLNSFKVFSGHYHRHQTIGTVTYIGSPYTVTSGEYNDGLKGILLLYEDGQFDRIDLKLRRHRVIETIFEDLETLVPDFRTGDFVRLKVYGNSLDLDKINKKFLIENKFKGSIFSLEKIYKDNFLDKSKDHDTKKVFSMENIIDLENEISIEEKSILKKLVKELLNENN